MSILPQGGTRRDLLKKLAAGAAVASAPTVAIAATTQTTTRIPDDAPWWLLDPIRPGTDLGLGWRAAALEFSLGAATLTLLHAERGAARVALSYHRGNPKGLVYTDAIDFILMDGGQGAKRTEESIGRVLMRLAEVVSANEDRLLAEPQVLARLMTHANRVAHFGPDVL